MVNKMTLTADEIDQILEAPRDHLHLLQVAPQDAWMYSDEELEQWCENWRSGLE